MVNLVLATVTAIKFQEEIPLGSDVAAAAPVNLDPEPELIEFQPPPIDVFASIVERPLFEPSRSPAGEEDVAIRLIGIFLTDDQAVALVRAGTQEQAIAVREGGFLLTWQVEKITANRLYLRRNGRELTVDLHPEPAHQGVTIRHEDDMEATSGAAED